MTRDDIYQMVTDKVINSLEQGRSWVKPFNVALAPRSSYGRPYRGINYWLLTFESQDKGYTSPFWLTFNQAKKLGGMVRKGQKGTQVILWKPMRKEFDDSETGEKTEKAFLMLKYFTVFNADQCDGLPGKYHPSNDARQDDPNYYLRPAGNPQPIRDFTKAQDVVDEYLLDGPKVAPGQPAYAPALDTIYMLDESQFMSTNHYYSTYFHEMAHSTGHASRLNREGIAEMDFFGTEKYAKEELVAELTASFVCSMTGVERVIENQAAYIKHWLGKLRDDPKLVVQAAAQAQKACDMLMGVEAPTTPAKDEEE